MTDDRLNDRRHQNLGRLLFEVQRHHAAASLAELHARGFEQLRESHKRVLVHLGLSGSRLTDLATRAGMSKQSMGALVDDLEAFGLVERVSDPADGRAKLVRFTAAGRDALQAGLDGLDAVSDSYAGLIGAERVEALRVGLAELVAALALELPR